jgi:aminobenzoyl-glutamate transport protein
MVASTFIIAFLGTWITEKIVIPRLGKYEDDESEKEEIAKLTSPEKKGLIRVGIFVAAFIAL